MKKPVYTDHAIEQMMLRGVSFAEIEAVLADYTVHVRSRRNDVFLGEVNGRRLKVVVAKDSNPPLIVTVADREQEGSPWQF